MPQYCITISFNDGADSQIVDLPGLTLERAEYFTGELRYEVEQARDIEAPVIQFTADDVPELTLEPGRIVSIDLEETTGQP